MADDELTGVDNAKAERLGSVEETADDEVAGADELTEELTCVDEATDDELSTLDEDDSLMLDETTDELELMEGRVEEEHSAPTGIAYELDWEFDWGRKLRFEPVPETKFEGTALGVGVEASELEELSCAEDEAVDEPAGVDDTALDVEGNAETVEESLEADTADEAPTLDEDAEDVELRPAVEDTTGELADDEAAEDELATLEDEATLEELTRVERGSDDELAALEDEATLEELTEIEDDEDEAAGVENEAEVDGTVEDADED
ncbi:hypothetical protein BKA66DRAFT_605318 [Pyrenochaeta sp. MPI-SDFR-AT-0127]|nr:hypothetical protein BKA66DRAFT_605318 [Pyrenochaeta sp. MPI-SDFR-AT-0127]